VFLPGFGFSIGRQLVLREAKKWFASALCMKLGDRNPNVICGPDHGIHVPQRHWLSIGGEIPVN